MLDTTQIQKELFKTNNVSIGTHEGYRFNDNNVASFGTKVGPVHSIEDGLLHEIGHAVELKDLNRLKQHHFGLEIKNKVEVFGKIYSEPITWNATKHEARAILWQEILCQHFNIEFDREKFAISLQYMPDFLNVPLGDYKWNSEKETYINEAGIAFTGDRDKTRLKSVYVYMKTEKLTGKYTYNNFIIRWNNILKYL